MPASSADPLEVDALSDGGIGAFRRVSTSDSDLGGDSEPGTPCRPCASISLIGVVALWLLSKPQCLPEGDSSAEMALQ